MDEESVYQAWLDFFSQPDQAGVKWSDKVIEIADQWPKHRSLVIPFQELYLMNDELSEEVLNNPDMVFRAGEYAINSLLNPDQRVGINLRISNLFESEHRSIRDIATEDLARYRTVEGKMNRSQEVRPKLLSGMFSCGSCGFKQEIIQDSFHFTEPLECPKDDGGCGKRAGATVFKFLIKESLFIDSQKIEVQENPEGLQSGQQPRLIEAHIEDDFCDMAFPGEVVKVTGIIKCKQLKVGKDASVVFKTFMEVKHISNVEMQEEIELTDERKRELHDIAKAGGFNQVMKSIFPTILVPDIIKEAFTLQLFGGIGKELVDGSWSRGDIHIYLIGDPGTAKTKIIRYMTRVLPRGQYASGKDTSGPGITAYALKDDFGEGRHTLVAGRIPLADHSICGLDEVSLMESKEIDRLREPMEDQICTVSKGGINARLNARCAIILGDNPQGGTFKDGLTVVSQISDKIPSPVLSRCDLILFLVDKPKSEVDGNIWRHVLMHKHRNLEMVRPPLAINEIRELILYCRQYDPEWSVHAIEYGRTLYEGMRVQKESGYSPQSNTFSERTRSITGRQITTIELIATAYARAELREVTENDVNRAFKIFEDSLRAVTGGQMDVDAIEMKATSQVRGKRNQMKEIIFEGADSNGTVSEHDVKTRLRKDGWAESEIYDTWETVRNELLYEPKKGSGYFTIINFNK